MFGSTITTVVIYCLIGFFGYISWVGTDQEAVINESANILEVNYKGNVLFTLGVLFLIFSIFCATPVCILPAKDAFE